MSSVEELGVSSYAKALRACTGSEDLQRGKQLHARILQSSHRKNTFLANCIVEMYGKCGSLEEARQAFDQISHPNVFSWNMMVTAYAQNGNLQEARSTFEKTPGKDVVAWNTILAAYAHSKNVVEAESIFQKIPEKDAVSWNTMLAAYAQKGELDLVEKFFTDMPLRNVVSWNTLIVAYKDSGCGEAAIKLVGLMDHEGIQPNRTTFLAAIDACASRAAIVPGKLIHDHVSSVGLERDVAIGTALIKMYARSGCVEKSLEVFRKMPVKNSITWNTIVARLAESGNLAEACRIYEKMPFRSVMSGNALIAAHAQMEDLLGARKLFDEMLERDVVTFTTMVSGYSQNGYGSQALSCFKAMVVEGIRPDQIALITLLEACAKNKALEDGKQAEKLIDELFSSSDFDIDIGSALVNMYAKCGSFDDAQRVFDLYKRRTAQHIGLWNAIFTALVENGKSDEAVQSFRQMLLEGVTHLNETTLLSVCVACVASATLNEARSIHAAVFDDPNVDRASCNNTLVGTSTSCEARTSSPGL